MPETPETLSSLCDLLIAAGDPASAADSGASLRECRGDLVERLIGANHQAGLGQFDRFETLDAALSQNSSNGRWRCDRTLAVIMSSAQAQLELMDVTRNAGVEDMRRELAALVTAGDNDGERAQALRLRLAAVGEVNEKIMALLVGTDAVLEALDALAATNADDHVAAERFDAELSRIAASNASTVAGQGTSD